MKLKVFGVQVGILIKRENQLPLAERLFIFPIRINNLNSYGWSIIFEKVHKQNFWGVYVIYSYMVHF